MRRDVGVSFRLKVELELPVGDTNRKFKVTVVKLMLFSLLEVSFLLLSHIYFIFLSAVGLFLHLSACAEYGGLKGSQFQ